MYPCLDTGCLRISQHAAHLLFYKKDTKMIFPTHSLQDLSLSQLASVHIPSKFMVQYIYWSGGYQTTLCCLGCLVAVRKRG